MPSSDLSPEEEGKRAGGDVSGKKGANLLEEVSKTQVIYTGSVDVIHPFSKHTVARITCRNGINIT